MSVYDVRRIPDFKKYIFLFCFAHKKTKKGSPEKLQPFPGWNLDLASVLL